MTRPVDSDGYSEPVSPGISIAPKPCMTQTSGLPLARRRLSGMLPIHHTGTAISYIAGSMFDHMAAQGADVCLRVPTAEAAAVRPFVRVTLGRGARWLAYHTIGGAGVQRLTAGRFVRSLRPGDLAYVWPGTAASVYREVKRRGAVLLVERINCGMAHARRILNAEAEAVGQPPDHSITDAMIAQEQAELQLADIVFAPSPLVAASVAGQVGSHTRILSVSYGWDPSRIGAGPRPSPAPSPDELRVLFVGTICLRKGVHRLLDAWKRSGVRGRLTLAGRLTEPLATWRAADLRRPDVLLTGHVADVEVLYRDADVFAFPSFEEGSPLVSYEALGAGLPCVLSPMGAGAVARDSEAIILPPTDIDGWAAAFRQLAADPGLRAELGRRAAVRAAEFTWERCAATRLYKLEQALVCGASGHGGVASPPEMRTTITPRSEPVPTHD